jgi:hypothetical protein
MIAIWLMAMAFFSRSVEAAIGAAAAIAVAAFEFCIAQRSRRKMGRR